MPRKLIIIDDFPSSGQNTSFVAGALRRALCGQTVRFADGTIWILTEAEIECWPNRVDQTPEQLVHMAKERAAEIGAIIVNLHLRLNASDRRSALRGLDVVEWLRTYPECAFSVLLYGWLKRETLQKDSVRGERLKRLLNGQGAAFLQNYKRLPLSSREFCSALSKTFARFHQTPQSSAGRLAKELMEDLLERENKRFRHRFNGSLRLAAVRLMLGVLQCEAIDETKGMRLLSDLYDAECIANPERAVILPKPADYNWGLLRRYRAAVNRPFVPAQPDRRKALLVDDESTQAGWSRVLRELLPPLGIAQLDVAGNSVEARNKLQLNNPSGNPPYSLVLLDLDLGEKTTGLELLTEIRKAYFFLPVIVFSNFDDARIAKACWQAGASYFAKQLRDPGDRRSVDYFKAFQETIAAALNEIPDWLPTLWRRFVRLEDDLTHLDMAAQRGVAAGFQNGEGIADAFRKVFYFLSARGLHLRYNILCLSNGQTGYISRPDRITPEAFRKEAEVYIGLAMEALLKTLGANIKCTSLYDAWNTLNYRVKSDITLFGIKYNVITEFLGSLDGAHWQRTPPTLYKCGEHLKTAIAFTAASLKCSNMQNILKSQRGVPISRARLELPKETHQIIRAGATSYAGASHGSVLVGRNAACQLLCGSLLQQNVTSPPENTIEKANAGDFGPLLEFVDRSLQFPAVCDGKVLLVENDPLWTEIVKRVLRIVGYAKEQIAVCRTAEQVNWHIWQIIGGGKGLNVYDFVVLDLWLPEKDGSRSSDRVGRELLIRIKSGYQALPVVMLTAANEVLPARRCLRSGALDYLPKQCSVIGSMGNNKAARDYSDTFLATLQRARLKGRTPAHGAEGCTRAAWERLQQFDLSGSKLKIDDGTYKKLKQLGRIPLGENLKPLRDVASTSEEFAKMARNLLHRAYFYLTIDESWFEQWRIERLLFPGAASTTGAGLLTCAWVCGTMVEMCLEIAATKLNLPGVTARVTAGKILDSMYPKPLWWDPAYNVWKARNDSLHPDRPGVASLITTEMLADTLRESISFAEKFEGWSNI